MESQLSGKEGLVRMVGGGCAAMPVAAAAAAPAASEPAALCTPTIATKDTTVSVVALAASLAAATARACATISMFKKSRT